MAALRLVAALILAFAAWLWGMPWPWLRAIAMVALPICAALNLVVSFCRGMPWEGMALATCPWWLLWPFLFAH